MTDEMRAQEKVESAPKTLAEPTFSEPTFNPLVDILESEDKLTLVADLPGVDSENLIVDLKDGTLTVWGKVTPMEENCKILASEYQEGDFYRQFSLSEAIDQEKISATLKNGVLTLEMPKVLPVEPKRIVIQAQ